MHTGGFLQMAPISVVKNAFNIAREYEEDIQLVKNISHAVTKSS